MSIVFDGTSHQPLASTSASPTSAFAPTSSPDPTLDQHSSQLDRTQSNDSGSAPDRLEWLFSSSSSPSPEDRDARDRASIGAGVDVKPAVSAHGPSAFTPPHGKAKESTENTASHSRFGSSFSDRLHSRSSTVLSSPPSSLFQSPASRLAYQPMTPHHAHSSSLTRTYSGNSSASTAASSDFLPTPKTPAVNDRWGKTAAAEGGSAAGGSDHKKGKGVTMVDPRFAFPKKRSSARKSAGPIITHLGEAGLNGGDEMVTEQSGSYVASLALAPLLDGNGNRVQPQKTRRASSTHPDRLSQSLGPSATAAPPSLLAAFDPAPPAERDSSASPPPTSQYKSSTIFQSQSKRRRRRSGSFAGSPKANSSPDLRALATGQPQQREPRRQSISPPRAAPTQQRVVTINSPNRAQRRRSGEVRSPVFHRDAGAAPTSICEALTFPRPRITALSPPGSPEQDSASFAGGGRGRSASSPAAPGKDKGKGKARQVRVMSPDSDELEEIMSIHGGYASSVRRVLAENEASRKEREDWSDSSAAGPIAAWADRRRTGTKTRATGDENAGVIRRKVSSRRKKKAASQRPPADGLRSAWSEDEAEHRLQRRVNLEYSPPVPHSFDPFTSIARKLSQSRRHGRSSSSIGEGMQQRLGLGFGGLTGSRSTSNLAAEARASSESTQPRSRQRSASAAAGTTAPGLSDEGPRFVGDRPIVHLGRSPSLDSLYQHTAASGAPRLPSQYGEALVPSNTVDLPASPRAVDRRQNAFVTLPPSMHHMLRQPDSSFLPSRPPPPVPFGPAFGTKLGEGARRMSSTDSSPLVIALGSRLSHEAHERDRRESERQLKHDRSLADLARREEQRELEEGRPPSQQQLEIRQHNQQERAPQAAAAGDWRSRRAAALDANQQTRPPVIRRRGSSLGLPKDVKSDGSTVSSDSIKSATSLAHSASTVQPPPAQAKLIGPAPGFGPRTIASHHRRGSSLSTVTPLSPMAAAINAARPSRGEPPRTQLPEPPIRRNIFPTTTQPAAAPPLAPATRTATPPLIPSRSTHAWATAGDQPFTSPPRPRRVDRPNFLTVDSETSGSSADTQVAMGSPFSLRSGGSSDEHGSPGGLVDLGGEDRPSFAGLFFSPPQAPRRPQSRRSLLTPQDEKRFSSATFSSDEGTLPYAASSAAASPEPGAIKFGTVFMHPFQMQRGPSADSQRADYFEQSFPRPVSNAFVELDQHSLDALFRHHGYTLDAELAQDRDPSGEEERLRDTLEAFPLERSSTGQSTTYITADEASDREWHA